MPQHSWGSNMRRTSSAADTASEHWRNRSCHLRTVSLRTSKGSTKPETSSHACSAVGPDRLQSISNRPWLKQAWSGPALSPCGRLPGPGVRPDSGIEVDSGRPAGKHPSWSGRQPHVAGGGVRNFFPQPPHKVRPWLPTKNIKVYKYTHIYIYIDTCNVRLRYITYARTYVLMSMKQRVNDCMHGPMGGKNGRNEGSHDWMSACAGPVCPVSFAPLQDRFSCKSINIRKPIAQAHEP